MNIIRHCLLVSLFLLTASAYAEVYKHTDAEGVTTYSDVIVDGATKLNPPEGNTIKLPKYIAEKKSSEEKKADYNALLIVSPQDDATIRDNSGNILISLSLSPELNTKDNHSISVYIDGTKAISKSTALTITISNVDRGSHTLYAVVSDAGGKTLIQSNSITVHLKQFSSLH